MLSADNVPIIDLAIILDKKAGLLKYGELSSLKDYFEIMIKSYTISGISEMADDLVLIIFDEWKTVLTKDDMCTFVNYMANCSDNGAKIMQMVSMSGTELKTELERLRLLGF